jgi:1-aminocyclopropane-1-carboxylate deaminase
VKNTGIKKNLPNSLQKEFPEALIVPEGGTNENAVKG